MKRGAVIKTSNRQACIEEIRCEPCASRNLRSRFYLTFVFSLPTAAVGGSTVGAPSAPFVRRGTGAVAFVSKRELYVLLSQLAVCKPVWVCSS